MSAARIAARLRERLPEADGWRVRERPVERSVEVERFRRWVGTASAHRRCWWSSGDARDDRPAAGRNWPERLADALADALLGAS